MKRFVYTFSAFNFLPFWVAKNELAQLEVAKRDALRVTVGHHLQDLLEQGNRLRLGQAAKIAHVRVQIAIVKWEEDERILTTDHNLAHRIDARVVLHANVRRQEFAIAAARHNLQQKNSY